MAIHESLTIDKMERAGTACFCINCGAEYDKDGDNLDCFHCDAHRSVYAADRILAMVPAPHGAKPERDR